MAGIDDAMWRLGDIISSVAGTGKVAGRVTATYIKSDPDGTAWFSVPGNPEAVPIDAGAYDYQMGDAVTIDTSGLVPVVVSNDTDPTGMRKVTGMVREVRNLAQDARAIADAIGQFFWHDDNGAHVSTEEGNPTGAQNTVWNALGMLFRKGHNVVLAIVTGDDPGMDVYDGAGNENENVIASYRGSGSRIGRFNDTHFDVTATRMSGLNGDNSRLFEVDMDGATKTTITKRTATVSVTQVVVDETVTLATVSGTTMDGIAQGNEFTVSFGSLRWGGGSVGEVNYDRRMPPSTGKIFVASFTYGTAGSQTIIGNVYNDTQMSVTFQHAANGDTTITFTPTQDGTEYYWRMTDVVLDYETSTVIAAPSFMFGTAYGSLGGFSATLGEGLVSSDNQLVAGTFNDNDPDNLFEVGNGADDANRSNAFAIDADGNVLMAGRLFDAGHKQLWSGTSQVPVSNLPPLDAIQLSEAVSAQPNGIVLVFSGYSSNTAQNYNWHFFYVPKAWVSHHSSDATRGITCIMSGAAFAVIGTKYVYVNDEYLSGHASNNQSGTANGISYSNGSFVLREVWGV